MAPSKPGASSAKQRRGTTAASAGAGSRPAAGPAADAAATPSGRPNGASTSTLRGRTPMTAGRKLHELAYNLHCVIGGPIWSRGENVVVYLLLAGVVALIAAGAYKQLARLLDMMLAAGGAGGGGGRGSSGSA